MDIMDWPPYSGVVLLPTLGDKAGAHQDILA